MCPKNGSKNSGPQEIVQTNFYPKKVGPENYRSEKDMSKKKSAQKKYVFKKMWVQSNCGSEKNVGPKMLCPTKSLVTKSGSKCRRRVGGWLAGWLSQ